MSSLPLSSGDGANGVTARSYYNVNRHHLPTTSASPRLPDVHHPASATARCSTSGSATLLSCPPSSHALQTLPELSDNVYAPVPLRSAAVTRALPAVPSHKGGLRPQTASPAPLAAPTTNSVFRPIAMRLSVNDTRVSSKDDDDFDEQSSSSSGEEGEEERVRPLLCPPMRPTTRVSPVLPSAVRTNPFCPEGVQVRHLPSCQPRIPTAGRVAGRHVTPPTGRIPLPSSSTPAVVVVDKATALWNEAATDAEVLAFFGSSEAPSEWAPMPATTVAPSATPSAAAHAKTASKELSWPINDTTQSSFCDLSFSEDMFSIGTTTSATSDGSAACGSHRAHVIDQEAVATFQRDGARRQREVFVAAQPKSRVH